MMHAHSLDSLFYAMLFLSSESTIDTSYVDTLPTADSNTLHDTFVSACGVSTARVMMGEVLEALGRHEEAVIFAQAEIQVRLSLQIH